MVQLIKKNNEKTGIYHSSPFYIVYTSYTILWFIPYRQVEGVFSSLEEAEEFYKEYFQ